MTSNTRPVYSSSAPVRVTGSGPATHLLTAGYPLLCGERSGQKGRALFVFPAEAHAELKRWRRTLDYVLAERQRQCALQAP